MAGARTDLLPVLPLVLSDGAAEDVILRCEGAGPGGQRSVSERERSSDATKEDFDSAQCPAPPPLQKRGVSNARSRRRKRGGPGIARHWTRVEGASAYHSMCRITPMPDPMTD